MRELSRFPNRSSIIKNLRHTAELMELTFSGGSAGISTDFHDFPLSNKENF